MEAQRAWFITGTRADSVLKSHGRLSSTVTALSAWPGISRPSSRQSGNTQTYSRSNSK